MMALWLFLHLLGFTLWLGGGFASMVAGIVAKRESREGLGAVVRLQAAVQRAIIAPGALLTVLSGLILTFSVTGRTGELVGFSMWLVVMQGAGIVGALITLLVGLPTATKLARLDPAGPNAAYFDELRQRQKVVASVAGFFALVALVAGALYRY
ncbi:MAG TPA: hypothetical protein VEB59_10910 [Gemmatimonadales bacterium]|nr:hypothetical protein [Gemmatimonadales bacterium]